MNLDLEIMKAPPSLRLDIVAEPQYAVVPTAHYNNLTGHCGFKVGFPLKLWRKFVLPHVEALITAPVTLFGQRLQATGWFARIAPMVLIRSTDQLVWVSFELPEYAACIRCANNLTCAPGVVGSALPEHLLRTYVGDLLRLANG